MRGPAAIRGFTYAVVLVLITIVGIMAGVAQEMTWRAVRAERETELLFRGEAYVRAIESFRTVNGQYPRELADLVRDPHSPGRRHLRALYPDPMSSRAGGGSSRGEGTSGPGGEGAWQLLRAADGGIQGVASRSEEEPLKKANFPKRWQQFEHAKSYREWTFEYVPSVRNLTQTRTSTPSPSVQ